VTEKHIRQLSPVITEIKKAKHSSWREYCWGIEDVPDRPDE